MEVGVLVEILAYTLAEVDANKLGNTLVDDKAVALIDALDGKLADVETKRLGETLGDVREAGLVNMFAYGLAEGQALGDRTDQVEAKALVDTLADTVVGMDDETLIEKISDVLAQILVDT